jgi:hypothetical protein
MDLLAELYEFVGAELIRVPVAPLFDGVGEALFARADAVLPNVSAGKRPTGPADGCGLKIGHGLQEIGPIAASGQGAGGEERYLVNVDRPRRRRADHQRGIVHGARRSELDGELFLLGRQPRESFGEHRRIAVLKRRDDAAAESENVYFSPPFRAIFR